MVVRLGPGQPKEKAHKKKHQCTQADGQHAEQATHPISRRKCPEQQEDRGYLADDNRADAPHYEKLSQTASHGADPGRLLS